MRPIFFAAKSDRRSDAWIWWSLPPSRDSEVEGVWAASRRPRKEREREREIWEQPHKRAEF